MEKVRDGFSGAVHATLASLGPIGAHPAQTCPGQLAPLYERASAQGRRFLGLGRRLAVRAREIRRADELGDTVGLTPDYRIKAKKVRELYLALLRDYREMRAAFYDQLGAEMRHAGCDGTGAAPAARASGGASERTGPDPANPSDWVLDPAEDEEPPAAVGKARRARGGSRARGGLRGVRPRHLDPHRQHPLPAASCAHDRRPGRRPDRGAEEERRPDAQRSARALRVAGRSGPHLRGARDDPARVPLRRLDARRALRPVAGGPDGHGSGPCRGATPRPGSHSPRTDPGDCMTRVRGRAGAERVRVRVRGWLAGYEAGDSRRDLIGVGRAESEGESRRSTVPGRPAA